MINMNSIKFKKNELIKFINSKDELKEKFNSIYARDVEDYFDEYKYIKNIHVFVASDMNISQENIEDFLNGKTKNRI